MDENREVLSRPAPPPDLTVSYGPHPDQVADVRLPPATPTAAPAPLLLLWHGGFWRAEYDRAHLGPMASDLAMRGIAVVSVEFRRTGGGGGWPTTFTDVAEAADALPALVAEAAPGRVTRDRVWYAGHSAGGHAAVWAALRDRLPAGAPGRSVGAGWSGRPGRSVGVGWSGEPGRVEVAPRVIGVLALAAVLDLADAYSLGLGEDAVGALLGGSPEQLPDRYAAADPAAYDAPGARVLLVHGDQDSRVPVAMSRRYAAATGCGLTEVAGADHFAVIDPESAAWPAVVDALHLLLAD